jgi:hypothetical protein
MRPLEWPANDVDAASFRVALSLTLGACSLPPPDPRCGPDAPHDALGSRWTLFSPTCAESTIECRQNNALANKVATTFWFGWAQVARAGKSCSARRLRLGRTMPRRSRSAPWAASGWVKQRKRMGLVGGRWQHDVVRLNSRELLRSRCAASFRGWPAAATSHDFPDRRVGVSGATLIGHHLPEDALDAAEINAAAWWSIH